MLDSMRQYRRHKPNEKNYTKVVLEWKHLQEKQ